MDSGLRLAEKIINDSGFFDYVIYGLLGLIVTFIYFYLAVLVLFALIESHIVAGAGIIVLGFSGSPWTSDIAKKYLLFALSVGLKMFFTFLIAGLGIKLVEDIVDNTGLGSVRTIFAIIGVLFMVAYLAQKIPALAQSVFSGVSSGNAPDMRGMAASIAKAGAAAALAVAGAGATVAAAHQAAKESTGGNATLSAASTSAGAEKTPGESRDDDASAIPNALSGGASGGGASGGEASGGEASGDKVSNASRLAKGLNYAKAFGAAYAKGAAATISKSHHFDTARNIRKQTLSKKIKSPSQSEEQ